ncbi:MAG: hypothetical protein JXA87_11635 [Thermoleophilia bacterium]|nr:hypothetical protein [Thermoleophilia bacterium]
MKRSVWTMRVMVAGLLVLCFVGLVACEHIYVFQKLEQVSKGMTYDEVVEIMGSPGEEVSRDNAGLVSGTYRWSDSGGVAELYFFGGRLESIHWLGAL